MGNLEPENAVFVCGHFLDISRAAVSEFENSFVLTLLKVRGAFLHIKAVFIINCQNELERWKKTLSE